MELTTINGIDYNPRYLKLYGEINDLNLWHKCQNLAQKLNIPIWVDFGTNYSYVKIKDPDNISWVFSDFCYSGNSQTPNLPERIQIGGSKAYFFVRQTTPEKFRQKIVPLALEWEASHREWVVAATVARIHAAREYLDLALKVERARLGGKVKILGKATQYYTDYLAAEERLESARKVQGSDFKLTASETIAVYSQLPQEIWKGIQGAYYKSIEENTDGLILPCDSLTAWQKGGGIDPAVIWQSNYSNAKVRIVDGRLIRET